MLKPPSLDVYPRQLVLAGQLLQPSRKSRFTTGFPVEARQPLAFHLGRNSVIPRRTYSETVSTVTWLERFKARSPSMAAISSIRLLVVIAREGQNSRSDLLYEPGLLRGQGTPDATAQARQVA